MSVLAATLLHTLLTKDPELTRSSGLDVAHLKAGSAEQAPLGVLSVVVVVVVVVVVPSRSPTNLHQKTRPCALQRVPLYFS